MNKHVRKREGLQSLLDVTALTVLQEQEHSGEQSRLRQLPAQELLFQMPFLQKLLQRLLDCKPTGAASHDAVVQASHSCCEP